MFSQQSLEFQNKFLIYQSPSDIIPFDFIITRFEFQDSTSIKTIIEQAYVFKIFKQFYQKYQKQILRYRIKQQVEKYQPTSSLQRTKKLLQNLMRIISSWTTETTFKLCQKNAYFWERDNQFICFLFDTDLFKFEYLCNEEYLIIQNFQDFHRIKSWNNSFGINIEHEDETNIWIGEFDQDEQIVQGLLVNLTNEQLFEGIYIGCFSDRSPCKNGTFIQILSTKIIQNEPK